MIETISIRQENVFVQLLTLVIQLNSAVGDDSFVAYALYPAICYSMLTLVYSLQLLARFLSQPWSLSSSRLVLGVKHLLLDVDRIRDKNLIDSFKCLRNWIS